VSLSFRVRYGAARQRLHRDDGTHLVEHESKPYHLKNSAQFGCLIAGVQTTQENGATMFVPGSHRWDDKREPRLDEVTFAGVSKIPLNSQSPMFIAFPLSILRKRRMRKRNLNTIAPPGLFS
jgi:ectoine hydroxylase-related dioxygenase (phytanoyl-CoA dioxygenase family)